MNIWKFTFLNKIIKKKTFTFPHYPVWDEHSVITVNAAAAPEGHNNKLMLCYVGS